MFCICRVWHCVMSVRSCRFLFSITSMAFSSGLTSTCTTVHSRYRQATAGGGISEPNSEKEQWCWGSILSPGLSCPLQTSGRSLGGSEPGSSLSSPPTDSVGQSKHTLTCELLVPSGTRHRKKLITLTVAHWLTLRNTITSLPMHASSSLTWQLLLNAVLLIECHLYCLLQWLYYTYT